MIWKEIKKIGLPEKGQRLSFNCIFYSYWIFFINIFLLSSSSWESFMAWSTKLFTAIKLACNTKLMPSKEEEGPQKTFFFIVKTWHKIKILGIKNISLFWLLGLNHIFYPITWLPNWMTKNWYKVQKFQCVITSDRCLNFFPYHSQDVQT